VNARNDHGHDHALLPRNVSVTSSTGTEEESSVTKGRVEDDLRSFTKCKFT